MEKFTWSGFFKNPSFWLCTLTVASMLGLVKLVIHLHSGTAEGQAEDTLLAANEPSGGVHIKSARSSVTEAEIDPHPPYIDLQLCKALENLLFHGKKVLELGATPAAGLYGRCFLRSPRTPPGTEELSISRSFLILGKSKAISSWWSRNNDQQVEGWTGLSTSTTSAEVEDFKGTTLPISIDLSKPEDFNGTRWQWGLYLEFPANLSSDQESNYITNMAAAVTEGLVVSWLKPEKIDWEDNGGQNIDYETRVASRFVKAGMMPDIEATITLRQSARWPSLKERLVVFRHMMHQCMEDSQSWWSYLLSFIGYRSCNSR